MRFALVAALGLCPLIGLLPAQEKSKPAPQDKSRTATEKSTLDKTAMESYVRHLLAVIPEVEVKIDDPKPSPVTGLRQVDVHFTYGARTQDETFYVTADGKNMVRGLIYDFAKNPFQADLDKLKTDLSPSFGAPGAPVVVVIFADFECPDCKAEAASLRENVMSAFPTQVRVYFKDLPLEQIHPWAKTAAIAGRCVFQQNPASFWNYFDYIYQHQDGINFDNLKSQVLDFAKTAPELDGLQLGRCMDTKATEAEVDASLAQARALHIDGTPTTFINGRRLVGNYPWPNLQQLINGELDYQKTTADAGEKCCEIKIPSPLNK